MISLNIVFFECVHKYLHTYNNLIHVTHKELQLYLLSKLRCQTVNMRKTKIVFSRWNHLLNTYFLWWYIEQSFGWQAIKEINIDSVVLDNKWWTALDWKGGVDYFRDKISIGKMIGKGWQWIYLFYYNTGLTLGCGT